MVFSSSNFNRLSKPFIFEKNNISKEIYKTKFLTNIIMYAMPLYFSNFKSSIKFMANVKKMHWFLHTF